METDRLKHFCTLAQTESLSRAADLLGITHSGLHKSIKALEDELGFKITKPKGRGITLTEQAQKFYPKALDIIKLVEESFSAHLQNAETKSLKLAGLEVFLPFLAQELTTEDFFKDYQFELHEFSPGQLEQNVLNKTVDYGLTYMPVPTKGLCFLNLSQFKTGVLYNNPNFLKRSVNEIPFVAPHAPSILNPADVKNRDGWADFPDKRLVKFKTNSLFAALNLVDSGQAAIFAPIFLIKHLKKTASILPGTESKKKLNLQLILRDETEEDIETKKICRLIRTWMRKA